MSYKTDSNAINVIERLEEKLFNLRKKVSRKDNEILNLEKENKVLKDKLDRYKSFRNIEETSYGLDKGEDAKTEKNSKNLKERDTGSDFSSNIEDSGKKSKEKSEISNNQEIPTIQGTQENKSNTPLGDHSPSSKKDELIVATEDKDRKIETGEVDDIIFADN